MMNLKELIAALTKLETVSGGETATQVMGVGLSIETEIRFENEYGYSRPNTEKRKASHIITVDVPQVVAFNESPKPLAGGFNV